MKVSKLTGAALDYAVGLCEGFTPGSYMKQMSLKYNVEGKVSSISAPINREYVKWSPTILKQGDDIIDREKIETRWCVTDSEGNGYWMAQNILTDTYGYSGTTRREAAMRCYVASKLGDEVELPEELK